MLKNLFHFFLIVLFIAGCARVGMPTGGPKDEKPPITLSAIPDFGTTHFQGNKIKINFDEYIKFKELNKQLIISPPMQNTPEITPSGVASKTINIKILDTLQPNTTYTFNFGNAIVDNAEGNPLQKFKYVFSTGSYLDSLQVKGSVIDAYNVKPDKEVLVMLYAVNENFNDSIIYKKKPDYVTNTLDSTVFNITNVKEGKYLLIALKDKSNNLKFNEKEDKIGFNNQFINLPQDTLPIQLTIFKPQPEFSVKKITESAKNHALIAYEGRWNGTIKNVTDYNGKEIKFKVQQHQNKDSLDLWYQNITTDSVIVNVEEKDKTQVFKFKQRQSKSDSLNINFLNRTVLHFRDTLTFSTNIPIEKINDKLIELKESDSIPVLFNTEVNANRDKFYILIDKKPTTNYKLTLYPKAVEDFFGHTNDTLVNKFTIKRLEDYGEIKLNVKRISATPLIIELLDEKGDVVITSSVTNSQNLIFSGLEPKKYSIRAVFDSNNNKIWDTGNYLKKLQPEKILYYPKIIELRANWSVNEDFFIE